MGVYSKIKRLLTVRTNQADKRVFKGEPAEAIAEIEKAREILWDVQQENNDVDLTEPVLAMDKLLRQEQAKWQDKVNDLANTSPDTNTDVSNPPSSPPEKNKL